MNEKHTANHITAPFLPPGQRIAYLDALRGIAALVVAVFWHYQHFSGKFQPGGLPLESAPGYGLFPFRLFYKYGFVAVDLFFIISGLVFSHVYSVRIACKQISAKEFACNRFSRLYPLHLATLLYVAVIVFFYHASYGIYPVYPINDGYHFLLNLLFVQKGFFDAGFSFNGPAWSLSIEAFLYCLFFSVALRGVSIIGPLLAILASLALLCYKEQHTFLLNEEIARGLGGFFVGMILYKAIAGKNLLLLLVPLAFIMAAAVLYRLSHHGHYDLLSTFFYPLCWIGFSGVILCVHYSSALRQWLEVRPLQMLGDISLAVYLIHVPLQMMILFVLKAMHLAIPYASPLFVLFYAVVTTGTAFLVYQRFEMPAQEWLRKKYRYGKASKAFTGTVMSQG